MLLLPLLPPLRPRRTEGPVLLPHTPLPPFRIAGARAPVVRKVRRGSAFDAALALQQLGSEAIVEELMLDRVARTGVAPAASMLNTWQKFHDLAFQHASEPVSMTPVTIRSLVLTGALFK